MLAKIDRLRSKNDHLSGNPGLNVGVWRLVPVGFRSLNRQRDDQYTGIMRRSLSYMDSHRTPSCEDGTSVGKLVYAHGIDHPHGTLEDHR
jgi:hypothetical protein